jgi:mono/diheme cytochrome c family protein
MSMGARTMARAGLGGCGALALTLAGCAPADDPASASGGHTADQTAVVAHPAGAPLPTGASITAMSDQYTHPRLGTTAATGASSWVSPAPPPAFVVSTPLPPGDPPAPPPAAVANRQPEPRPAPAAAATESARPAAPAAAPPAPAAPATSVDVAKGRQLFANYGCTGCHVLADGGGSGAIGPSLDHNPRLSQDYVRGAIAEGRGAMPAFRDQLSADEIATLAAYVVQAARK